MKNIKPSKSQRLVTAVLAFIFLVASLASCGGGGPSNAGTDGGGTATFTVGVKGF